jgi:predicted hydrocarbon binding protein
MIKYDDIISKAAGAARKVMKKSNKVVEITKLNLALGEIKSDIDIMFKQMGKKVYKAYENGTDIPEDIESICSEIKEKYKRIDDIQSKVAELKRIKICPECQKEASQEDTFCSKCGYEYETDDDSE